MDRFPIDVASVLLAAGWYPGRSVLSEVKRWADTLSRQGGFRIFPAAEAALAEFGGLHVTVSGPGISAARSPFELNPLLAAYEDDRFADLERLINIHLYPLGELMGGNSFLLIDESGRVFGFFDFQVWWIEGQTIDEALVRLVRGINGDPVDETGHW